MSKVAMQQLYFMGTGNTSLPTTDPRYGPDGAIDQDYSGTAWGYTHIDDSAGGTPSSPGHFLATTSYDSGTQRCYFFGNTDSGPQGRYYGLASDTWTPITNIPANCFGQGAGACIAGVCYCLGGIGAASTGANKKVFSWATSNANNGAYVTTYQDLPEFAISCFAVAVGSLVYHGGGDTGDENGTPTAHWYKWNPLTDTRTSLANIPIPLYGAAAVYDGGNYIYLIGGATTGQTLYQGTTTVYRYSISGDSWSLMTHAFPQACTQASAGLYNGNILVTGGWNASGFNLSGANANGGVYQYNAGADSWSLHSTLAVSVVGSILFSPQTVTPVTSPYRSLPTSAAGW